MTTLLDATPPADLPRQIIVMDRHRHAFYLRVSRPNRGVDIVQLKGEATLPGAVLAAFHKGYQPTHWMEAAAGTVARLPDSIVPPHSHGTSRSERPPVGTGGPVLVALKRSAGYGDVHAHLVAVDALDPYDPWPHEVLRDDGDEVIMALERPEGYEDAPAQEVAGEAIKPAWSWRLLPTPSIE